MRLITSLLAAAALAPALAGADTIKVGIANDISGPFSALGAEARDGFNLAIKQLGGIAVVQDWNDALFPSMPAQAAHHVAVDYSVPVHHMGGLLTQLSATAPGDRAPEVDATLGLEVAIAKNEPPARPKEAMIGPPSVFTCPECHGVLMRFDEGGRRRFRCHTGHAYSRESLLTSIDESIQSALDNALRSLEEGQMLIDEMLAAPRQAGETGPIEVRLDRAKSHAATMRELIDDWEGIAGVDR